MVTVPSILLKTAKQIISSKDTGFKLIRIAGGTALLGGGIAVGANLATGGITDSANKANEVFGIPKELLFIIGALIIVLVLMKK